MAAKTVAEYLDDITKARQQEAAAIEAVSVATNKRLRAERAYEDYRISLLVGTLKVGDKIKVTNRVEKELTKQKADTTKKPVVTGFKYVDGAVIVVVDANGQRVKLPLVMVKEAQQSAANGQVVKA